MVWILALLDPNLCEGKEKFLNIGLLLWKYSFINIEVIIVNLNKLPVLNSLLKEEMQQS